MDVILFLQALEPRSVIRLVFGAISWCGDGPLYMLLFPLLYWGKAPSVAVRYGYLWGWAVLVMTVLKGHDTTLRPFLEAPEQVAFLQPLLAGFYWFPSQDLLLAAYRQSPAFPSGHALVATALGLYLAAHTPSVGWRWLLGGGIVLIAVARVYLGVHYPTDVLAGSAIGALLWALATRVRWPVLAAHGARWSLWPWRGLLLTGTLIGVLAVMAPETAVVWLLLLSYPVLLIVARRPIAAYAANRGTAWRTANAVGGCVGVAGLLLATAPLRSLGTLLSVPLVTAWVTLGCPYLLQHLSPVLRHRVPRTGSHGGQCAGSGQPLEQGRPSSRRDGAGEGLARAMAKVFIWRN
jgi:membrane-associated phospholipid phosphatase